MSALEHFPRAALRDSEHGLREKLTTNLTNLTNGTKFQGSPHDALVVQVAMRPGVCG
jgi:hypothetical protein